MSKIVVLLQIFLVSTSQYLVEEQHQHNNNINITILQLFTYKNTEIYYTLDSLMCFTRHFLFSILSEIHFKQGCQQHFVYALSHVLPLSLPSHIENTSQCQCYFNKLAALQNHARPSPWLAVAALLVLLLCHHYWLSVASTRLLLCVRFLVVVVILICFGYFSSTLLSVRLLLLFNCCCFMFLCRWLCGKNLIVIRGSLDHFAVYGSWKFNFPTLLGQLRSLALALSAS